MDTDGDTMRREKQSVAKGKPDNAQRCLEKRYQKIATDEEKHTQHIHMHISLGNAMQNSVWEWELP